MLTKGVLPAPLVPIRPTTESLAMAAFTSAAAVTAPKLLHNARASSRIVISPPAPAREQRPQAVRQERNAGEQRDAELHLPGVRRGAERQRIEDAEYQRAEKRRQHVSCATEYR